MFKLMIVDDEAWVRERLMYTFDWESKGIEIVEEASSGQDALEKAKRNPPDIILTDIRMPIMDGLQFIQGLKDSGIDAKTIIISGYSDFDYAKKAISLGAYDYILKPVEDENLLSVVERCMNDIKNERSKADLVRKADHQVNRRLPLMKHIFFANLIHNNIPNKQEVVEALDDFGIHNEGTNHICFIIHVYNSVAKQQESNNSLIGFVIQNVAEEIINRISENDICFTSSGEFVGIVSSKLPVQELTKQLTEMAEEIKKIVNRILQCDVTIGIGGVCTDMLDISLSYRQAKQSALANGYLFKAVLNLNPSKNVDSYQMYDTEHIVNSIMMSNKEAAIASLEQIMQDNPFIQPSELKFLYMNIVHSIVKMTLNGKKSIEDFSNYVLSIFEILHGSQNVKEIFELLKDAIEKMIDYVEQIQGKRIRKVVEKALEYMQDHHSKPLSLNTVADKLFLNASYLSKVFKEEMGVSFSKYLMEYRMDKAIELMSDATLKIYEVANSVGYEDVQYFTKIFKSIKGVTPMQYRENISR